MNKPCFSVLVALVAISWAILPILILALVDPHAFAGFWRSLNVFGGAEP